MKDSDKESVNDEAVLQMPWPDVELKLDEFNNCLEREAEFAVGRLKLRIARVLSLLKSQPDRDEVLAHRDALAALLPLITFHHEEISIESAVRMGVKRIAGNDVYRRNYLGLFWYPALVMVIAFFVCVMLSFTAAPAFEETFKEMGIDIDSVGTPWATRLSLGAATVLRITWVPVAVLLLLAAIGIGWMNQRGRKNNASGLGWWDDRNVSVRGALAIWSDHLSSLLQVGVTQADAFELASRETPKKPLRRLSAVLAARDQLHGDNALRPYLPLKKYAMLDHALRLNRSPSKAAMLQEVSIYYRDRDRYVSTWWMSWLSLAMLWLTGAMVFVLFLAILSPLNQMMHGITGTVSGVVGLGN